MIRRMVSRESTLVKFYKKTRLVLRPYRFVAGIRLLILSTAAGKVHAGGILFTLEPVMEVFVWIFQL